MLAGPMRAASFLLAPSLLAGACGTGDELPGRARVERLELELATDAAERSVETTVARLTPLEGVEGIEAVADRIWIVDLPEDLIGPSGDPRRAYFASEPGSPFRIRFEGPFDPSAFRFLRVAGTFAGTNATLAVVFLRDGARVGRSGPVPVHESAEVQGWEVTVPVELRTGEACDGLELRLEGGIRVFGLDVVDLVDRRGELLLPDPTSGPDVLFVDGSSGRRGVALASGRPLEAIARVPAEGVLSFSIAEHEHSVLADRDLTLRLELASGGEPVLSERLGLPRPVDGTPQWLRVERPLAEHSGSVLAARFALETSDGRPAACVLAEAALHRPAPDPPTVVLITTDTHRGDHVGSADGGADVRTPALDAVAASGVFFEECWTPVNVTNPSHVALMTGTHPRDTGIVTNHVQLAAEAPTLAEALHERGFATIACISAYHLVHPISGVGQGFDRMSAPLRSKGERRARETVDETLAWMDELEGRPLFVWTHLFDAHWPYAPPEEFLPEEGSWRPDPPALPWPESVGSKWLRELPDLESERALYRAEVAYLDSQLARLLEHPRLRDAVLAVVGDHGESLGGHSIWFSHHGLYRDTLHVPLYLRYPGAPAGRRVAERVRHWDVGRTLLDLAGFPDAPLPGTSLLRHLEPGGLDAKDDPHFAIHANGLTASITTRDRHLELALRDCYGARTARRLEAHDSLLFDLELDPLATTDVAAERPEEVRELRSRLVDWLAGEPPTTWRGASTLDVAEELAAMGYLVDVDPEEPLWIPDGCAHCERYR